jgi:hypothetical protein
MIADRFQEVAHHVFARNAAAHRVQIERHDARLAKPARERDESRVTSIGIEGDVAFEEAHAALKIWHASSPFRRSAR